MALETDKHVQVKAIGDFEGICSAGLSQTAEGVHVAIIWHVTVLRPVLKFPAPLLRPVFAWNHRWTTPRGVKGQRDFLAMQKNK